MKTPLLDLGIYRVVRCGIDTVRTEFCHNGQIITPAGYCGPDRVEAAIYFTERYLKEEMEEQIHILLGGSSEGRDDQPQTSSMLYKASKPAP